MAGSNSGDQRTRVKNDKNLQENDDNELSYMGSFAEKAEVPSTEMEIEEEVRVEFEPNPLNFGDVPFLTKSAGESPESASSSNNPMEANRASDLLMAVSISTDTNKAIIRETVVSSMNEFIRKAVEGEPLWHVLDNGIEILNEGEYIRQFRDFDASLQEIMRMVEVGLGEPQFFSNSTEVNCGSKRGLRLNHEALPGIIKTEASRQIGFIGFNAMTIIEWLMDVNKWSSIFSNMVSGARNLGVISSAGSSNYVGTIQVMTAEFQMPTPLIPARKCQFARCCQQIGSTTWAIFDVSLENLFTYPQLRFRRRPSGCLIEELPNGHSKITWVEHMEVDNSLVHQIFRPLVLSGFAFSAKRWVATLIQHCEMVIIQMSENIPAIDGVLICKSGKESLLRLASRMVRSFCIDLSASTNNLWMPLPMAGAEDCRVMTKSITPTSGTRSTTLVFTTSILLSSPPKRVFDFFRQEDSRNKYDLLSRNRLVIKEITRVMKGPDNFVSVMQAKSSPDQIEIMYLQEAFSDPIAFYVVYAPIDVPSMVTLLNGGDPDIVNVLPSGFVIHPDRWAGSGIEVGGSILTIAFRIIDKSSKEDSIPIESISSIHRILEETSRLIQDAVLHDNTQ